MRKTQWSRQSGADYPWINERHAKPSNEAILYRPAPCGSNALGRRCIMMPNSRKANTELSEAEDQNATTGILATETWSHPRGNWAETLTIDERINNMFVCRHSSSDGADKKKCIKKSNSVKHLWWTGQKKRQVKLSPTVNQSVLYNFSGICLTKQRCWLQSQQHRSLFM